MVEYFAMLIISIILHELAHLSLALFWKVKVHACSLGFGKILWNKVIKGIDWRISAIPLGGYCNIEEDINKPNNLFLIPYWKQLTIILAGVTVNLLIAFFCYLINYGSIKIGFIIDLQIFQAFLCKDTDLMYSLLSQLKNVNLSLLQLSLLNISLGIFNLIPFPCLDGGFIWLLPLRKKISTFSYELIVKIGFVLLIVIQPVFIYYIYFRS